MSQRQVSGRNFPQDGLREEVLPQRPFRKQISQLVDSDTVDPGWDGELMDNAFASAENIMCNVAGETSSICRETTVSRSAKLKDTAV